MRHPLRLLALVPLLTLATLVVQLLAGRCHGRGV